MQQPRVEEVWGGANLREVEGFSRKMQKVV